MFHRHSLFQNTRGLTRCDSWKQPDMREWAHIGCSNCHTSHDEFKQYVTSMAAGATEDATAFDTGRSMSADMQPTITQAVLSAYYAIDKLKSDMDHLADGIKCAYDSADVINKTATISTDTTSKQCRIKVKCHQSQAKSLYTPEILFQLDDTCATVTEVLSAQCPGCILRHEQLTCDHRDSLLAWMYINSCAGFAGNPTARDAYWRGRAGNKVPFAGGKSAYRFVELLTHRREELTAQDLVEMEKTCALLHEREASDTDLPRLPIQLDPDSEDEEFAQELGSGGMSRDEWKRSVDTVCTRHFTLNEDALFAIEKAYKLIGRLGRDPVEECNPVDKSNPDC